MNPPFAKGGLVGSSDSPPLVLMRGCDYIIPTTEVLTHSRDLLKRLNEMTGDDDD